MGSQESDTTEQLTLSLSYVDISPMADICAVIIFSWLWLPSSFFKTLSFNEEILNLIKYNLSFFLFCFCALGIISPYHFQDPHQGPLFLSFPLGVSGNPKILTVILCTGFWGDFSFVGCVDTSVCLSVYGLNVVH